MPKTHPSDTAKIVYRIKPPSVWRAIRAEWEAGAAPVDVARRFDVSASAVQARRDREGWSREGMLAGAGGRGAAGAAAQGETGAAARGAASGGPAEFDMLSVNAVALAAAVRALERGRPADAVALVQAADRVGCFAAYVAELREEIEDEADGGGEDEEATAAEPAAGGG